MLVLIMGLFRSGGEDKVAQLQQDFTGHLAQPLLRIRSAGRLRKPDGSSAGFLFLLDAETLEDARAFLATDPFLGHDLYDQVHLLEYDGEAGRV